MANAPAGAQPVPLRAKARQALIAAAALALLAAACGGDGDERKERIVFGAPNWESARLQTRIAEYIVRHGYGYPTDVISGETIPLIQGLAQRDVDVVMEVWLPNASGPWGKAGDTVAAVGQSLRENWQGFAIPRYVRDANPGLVSVFDLPDYVDAFATAESHGRIRLLNCIAGWACEGIIARKIEAYGLGDVIDLVTPGSEAAVFADLEGAYARGEPWIGYVGHPSRPTATLDLYLLEEPAWTEECWATDLACGFPVVDILIGVHETLPARAPEIVEFLGAWDYSTEDQVYLQLWLLENDASFEEGAIHYLRTRRERWSAWTPDAVAAKVDAALAGEGQRR